MTLNVGKTDFQDDIYRGYHRGLVVVGNSSRARTIGQIYYLGHEGYYFSLADKVQRRRVNSHLWLYVPVVLSQMPP